MYRSAEAFLIPFMFFILLGVTILLWLLLHDASERVKNVPFIVITVLLIVGEVGKQALSIKQGYDFWNLPLHFCCTYFLWFSLAEFSFGKFRQTMQKIAFVATLYLCVGLYVAPRGILGSACENVFGNYFTAHSFFFHHLVILYMMLSIAFKRFKPQKRDAWVWKICFTVYFTTAAICAYTFQENFFDILNSEPLPIFEPFRLAVGQVAYNACLALVVVFFGAVFIRVAVRVRQKCFVGEEKTVKVLQEK